MSDYEPEMITVSLAEWNANVSRLAALEKSIEIDNERIKHLLEENRCFIARIAELEEEITERKKHVSESLLRNVAFTLPDGCYCKQGKCGAPKPEWCRDPVKRSMSPQEQGE